MSTPPVPVDIQAVKEYGIAQWQREFFWPVSDKAYTSLCHDLDQTVRTYIATLSEELEELFLLKRNLLLEYWHMIHAYDVLCRLQAKGARPLCAQESLWYQALMDGSFHTMQGGFTEKRVTDIFPVRGKWRRNKTLLAMRARSVWHNRSRQNMRARWHGDVVAKIFGVPSSLQISYMRTQPFWISVTAPWDWFSHSTYHVSNDRRVSYDHLARTLVRQIAATARRHGVDLHQDHEDYLLRCTVGKLEDAEGLLARARARLQETGSVHRLFLPNIFSPLQRAAAIAVRRAGGHVTAFSHGGNAGLFSTPLHGSSEFALADTVVTYSQGGVESYQQMRRAHPVWGRKPVSEIVAMHDPRYARLQHAWQSHPRPTRVERVMLVGFPYAPWRRPYGGASFVLMQLDLELRLVAALRARGYAVIYKVHPDRRREAEGVFDTMAEVIHTPFEQVLHLADAFVFSSIRTTAFPYALCTNRVVIGCLAPHDVETMMPDARALLEKRCHLMETRFDDRNRLVFDRDALMARLAQTPCPPNMEYVETYLA